MKFKNFTALCGKIFAYLICLDLALVGVSYFVLFKLGISAFEFFYLLNFFIILPLIFIVTPLVIFLKFHISKWLPILFYIFAILLILGVNAFLYILLAILFLLCFKNLQIFYILFAICFLATLIIISLNLISISNFEIFALSALFLLSSVFLFLAIKFQNKGSK